MSEARTDTKPDSDLTGLVRAVQANFYRVQLQHPLNPSQTIEVLCTRRSRLKKLGQTVVVGDRVYVTLDRPANDSVIPERGAIEGILERRTYLPRPPIANIDQALVVFALADPPFDPWQLSRFLVQAEASQLRVQVCLNKLDLIDPEQAEHIKETIKKWGYDPILFSVEHHINLEAIAAACQSQISVVTGLSGVGKSSLLNWLIPGLDLATQDVSGRLKHGQHTTRHVELFPLALDPSATSWIADSPGFNQADFKNCTSTHLAKYFPEVKHLVGHCQFRNCLHQHEPGCLIREFNWDRYSHYLKCLDEVLDHEHLQQSISQPDPTVKYHSKRKDRDQAVPRLASRFRQASRRQHTQKLHQLTADLNTDEPED